MTTKVETIQAEEIAIKARLGTYQAALSAVPFDSPEYDELSAKRLSDKQALLSIPEKLKQALIDDNKALINQFTAALNEGIWTLVDTLKFEGKTIKELGIDVRSLNSYRTESKNDKGEPVLTSNTFLNPGAVKAKAEKKEGDESGERKERSKGSTIIYPDKTSHSVTEFVKQFVSDDDYTSEGMKKYPHTVILQGSDKKKQELFTAFCTKHNLIGYTLQIN